MPAWVAVAVPYQMGPPAVPAPAMAATTQGPAMKQMGCMMVRSWHQLLISSWGVVIKEHSKSIATRIIRCGLCHCLGEEEAMDHQVSPEPENGQSEEEEEASDLENGSKGDTTKLFTFSIVNSYGTANISPLPCDGNVLKLNRQCTSLNFNCMESFLFSGHFTITQLLPRSLLCSTFHSGHRLGHRVEETLLWWTRSRGQLIFVTQFCDTVLKHFVYICVNIVLRLMRSMRACCSPKKRKPLWL